jgi:hypothetical protein
MRRRIGLSCGVPATAALPGAVGHKRPAAATESVGHAAHRAGDVTIEYSSPRVVSPTGEDRRGKIWGGLVPYGIHDLGFNDRRGPWRAGANENTVFSASHPVKVQAEALRRRRYGLHDRRRAEWTIIFSKNAPSWGFSYDEAETCCACA